MLFQKHLLAVFLLTVFQTSCLQIVDEFVLRSSCASSSQLVPIATDEVSNDYLYQYGTFLMRMTLVLQEFKDASREDDGDQRICLWEVFLFQLKQHEGQTIAWKRSMS